MGKFKLTKEQELEICKLYTDNSTIIEISKKFNIGEATVIRIVKRHGIYQRRTGERKIIKISKEMEIEICEKYDKFNITIRSIAKILNIPVEKIRNVLKKNNIRIKTYTEIFGLTEVDKQNIIKYYIDENKTLRDTSKLIKRSAESVRKFLNSQNIPIRCQQEYLRTELSELDELNIIDDYVNKKIPSNIIQRKYKIKQERFWGIMKKYGHEMRKPNDLAIKWLNENQLKLAIDAYNKIPRIKTICKLLNVSRDCVERSLISAGIELKTVKENISQVEIWEFLYGKEKALELEKQMKINLSKASSGKNNPMYGRSSPNGSGQGWKGWYKDFYFRSLRELSYVIYLDENNIKWESAEQKRFRIPYKNYDGKERTYAPDFLIENKKLVEIKPKRLQKSPLILLKTAAAMEFCKNNELEFEIFDFKINPKSIKKALSNGLIKFTRDYEKRFLEYCDKTNQK